MQCINFSKYFLNFWKNDFITFSKYTSFRMELDHSIKIKKTFTNCANQNPITGSMLNGIFLLPRMVKVLATVLEGHSNAMRQKPVSRGHTIIKSGQLRNCTTGQFLMHPILFFASVPRQRMRKSKMN